MIKDFTTEQILNKPVIVSSQILFIGQQLSDQTYEKYISGYLSIEELTKIYKLLSSWSKLSQEIVDQVEK